MDAVATRFTPDPVAVALANLADVRRPATLFVGPVGSGKTHVLRELVTQLHASARLGRRLGTLDLAAPAELRRLLAADPPGAPVIVAADDLDGCDPAGLRLVAEALDRGRLQLVGTVSAGGSSLLMSRLRPARPPTLVPLQPWTAGELDRYAAGVLDGPLSRWSAHRLVRFAGGNPLCLAELLEQGRVAGQLQHRYGTWVWTGEPTLPPGTVARVWEGLRPLEADVLEVVALLALAGPTTLARLGRLVGTDAVERAEAGGLVVATAHHEGSLVLSLARPLEGGVVLACLPLLRVRALTARLAAVVLGAHEPRDAAADQALRVVRWCRETGLPLPPPTRLGLARAALARHRPELVAGLLADGPDGAEADRLRVAALAGSCRFAEAASVLAEQPGDGGADAAVRVAGLRAMAGGPGRRERLPAGGAARLAAAWCGVVPPAGPAGADVELRPSTSSGGERMRGSEPGALVVAVVEALQAGRAEAALALARRLDAAAVERLDPPARLGWWVGVGFAHLLRGAVPEAEAVSASLVGLALRERWPLAYAAGTLLAGRCALLQGRTADAVAALVECVTTATRAAPALGRALPLWSLAAAYRRAGREQDAERAAQEAAAEEGRGGPALLDALAALTRAEVLRDSGRPHAAVALAERVRAAAEDDGQGLVALLAAALLAQLEPGPARTDRVRAAAAATDFTLAAVHLRHAEALELGDGARLAQVSEVYADAGLHWPAGEAAAAALRTAAARTVHASWAGPTRRRVAALLRDGTVCLPRHWDAEAEPAVALTGREQEVAEAVLAGQSAAGIAAALQLSRRTVENHLQHVYRKLGVTSRAELVAAWSLERRAEPEPVPARGPGVPVRTIPAPAGVARAAAARTATLRS